MIVECSQSQIQSIGTRYEIDDTRSPGAIALLQDTRHRFIYGAAGSGKTTFIKEQIDRDPSWGFLTATTGVAAVNLGEGVPTINSALDFFSYSELPSMSNKLRSKMKKIRETFRHLVIDEASMLPLAAFELILSAADDEGLGLVLVGDFLQLAPVKDTKTDLFPPRFCFLSKMWNCLDILKLTKIHRQSNEKLLEGLDLLRRGNLNGVKPLLDSGVTFIKSNDIDENFDGVTLVGENDTKNKINNGVYINLPGRQQSYIKLKHGPQLKGWIKDIPDSVELKVGAKVMINRNLYERMSLEEWKEWNDSNERAIRNRRPPIKRQKGRLLQANGDFGTVTGLGDDFVNVQVRRNDGSFHDVKVERYVIVDSDRNQPRIFHNGKFRFGRTVASGRNPESKLPVGILRFRCDDGEEVCVSEDAVIVTEGQPVPLEQARAWVSYMPLDLAWAINVHKAQGLTLPAIQVFLDDRNFSFHAMTYVALSRCRDPKNIRIYLFKRTEWPCAVMADCLPWCD